MSQSMMASSSKPSCSPRNAPLPSGATSLRSGEQEAQNTPLAPTPSRRRRPRVHRPARGSIHDLLRQYSGKALFVRPICWTDLHAKLLGAEFEELPPCVTPLPFEWCTLSPLQLHRQPSPTITTLGNALSEIFQLSAAHPIMVCNAVKVTLTTLWPGAFSRSQCLPELNIFLGPKMYHDAVRVQAMWNFPTEDFRSQSQGSTQSTFDTISLHSSDSQSDLAIGQHTNLFESPMSSRPILHRPTTNLPMLCYIGKDRSSLIRNSMFRICSGPGKSLNIPVLRLHHLRAKMLVPLDPDQDAHFVGIFLAMAQRHFYEVLQPAMRRESFWWPLDKGPLPHPEFRDLKLKILTHDSETSEFLIYTGHITAKFLERFHRPFANPESDESKIPSGMKIEYTRVPAWPILGLRERLGKALGEEIVGPFDPNKMETWEEDEDDEDEDEVEKQKQDEKKRNRDALAQVLNGSFEKDSESESQDRARKKRRLRQGRRVGVVV